MFLILAILWLLLTLAPVRPFGEPVSERLPPLVAHIRRFGYTTGFL